MIAAATLSGTERATLDDGRSFRGPNAEGDAARALLADGVDRATRLTFFRDGRPALIGTVGAFAGRAWAGGDRDPSFRSWRPHPHAEPATRHGEEAPQNGGMGSGRHLPALDDVAVAGTAGGSAA